jgi:hypothetical protein
MFKNGLSKSFLLILGLTLLSGPEGCAIIDPYVINFDPICAGYPDYNESTALDGWINSQQTDLVNKFGPPDSKDSDGKGGQYFLYENLSHYRVEFYINVSSVIYSWQWQRGALSDTADEFVTRTQKNAFDNACNGDQDGGQYTAFSPEQYLAAIKLAASFSVTLGTSPHYDYAYLDNLASWYDKGAHVAQDRKKAFQYYTITAALDDPNAELALGDYYEEGAVVPRNLTTAREWYEKAAAGRWRFNGPSQQIAKDRLAKLDSGAVK